MDHLSVDIRVPIEKSNVAIQRIESLCIKCGKCRDVCKQQISVLSHYDLDKTKQAICVHCGQCINVCPTNALVEKKEYMDVAKAIHEGKKKVVVLTSPSIRVALGEEFGREPGSFVEKKMVGALRKLGVDYVFDTTFAADLTIMEEASELIDRITNNKPLPQFTSCCPAWVRFAETYYPELLPNISTSKSPISMFGPTVKTYFAKKESIPMEDIVCIALTPCTAKKAEIRRDEMCDASLYAGEAKQPDVDHVITTRELAQWLKAENLSLDDIKEGEYDSLMPRGSGAGVIFGNTGGVMEAALRSAYYVLTGEQPNASLLKFEPIRGIDEVKVANLKINEIPIKVAAIHTLSAIRKFIATQDIKEYQFIEVMCCKGGCIGGGGQPKPATGITDEVRLKRIQGLYAADEKDAVRNSHDNEAVQTLYRDFYEKPLSPLAEKMLHTTYQDRSQDLNEDPKKYDYKEVVQPKVEMVSTSTEQWICSVCGYVYDGVDFNSESEAYVCPLCNVPKTMFDKKEVAQPKVETSKQWVCSVCGYVYEGEDFTIESEDYVCPLCNVPKMMFEEK